MAKKKKRIPKTIGGVKLPKDLRRAGEAILDTAITTANSPQGKAFIATGLSMAAAAAAKAAERRMDEPAAAQGKREPHDDDAAASRPGTGGIDGDAIGQAVEQVLGRFFGRR